MFRVKTARRPNVNKIKARDGGRRYIARNVKRRGPPLKLVVTRWESKPRNKINKEIKK